MKNIIKNFGLTSALLVTHFGFANSVPNRILIQNKNSFGAPKMLAAGTLQKLAPELGMLKTTSLSILNGNVQMLRYSTNLNPIVASQMLMESGAVDWAQPDYFMKPQVIKENIEAELPEFGFDLMTATPNDPEFSKLWGLNKIMVPQAWTTSSGSDDVIVADIDTGVDFTHEDLKANMWRNPKPTKGDIYGYDFADKDADPSDTHGHGTHTSGTIGARGDNGLGVVGVNQKVKIMALKFIGDSGQGSTSGAIEAIEYATAHGARVINASWGGYIDASNPDDVQENKLLQNSIEAAGEKEILFVAAAGNDGIDADKEALSPACFTSETIIAVASTTNTDRRSFFSNFGAKCVDVGAPGSTIYSTVPGNKYAAMSGTSMAAPHVAGMAALMLSINPQLSALELKELIMSTGDKISALEGITVSGNRVNVKTGAAKAKSF